MSVIQSFVKKLLQDALNVERDEGFHHLFLLSQVALETGWLKHVSKDEITNEDSKNLFNIKGSYNGEYVTILTTEYDKNKVPYKIKDKFRKYPSYEESIKDWVKLLKTSRYKLAYDNRHDLVKLTEYIHKCGYATDPNYVTKILNIANTIEKEIYKLNNDRKVLKIGDKGNDVKKLQEQLLKLKYNVGDIDGIFGEKTKQALMNFQKDNQLTVDGIAGNNTYFELNKLK